MSHGIHLLWSGDQHVIVGPKEEGSRGNSPLKQRRQLKSFCSRPGVSFAKSRHKCLGYQSLYMVYPFALESLQPPSRCFSGGQSGPQANCHSRCCDQMGWVPFVCSILHNSYSVSTTHSFLAILANGVLARISEALHMVRRFSNEHQA